MIYVWLALAAVVILLALNFTKIKRLIRTITLFNEGNIVGNFSDMAGMFFSTPLPIKSSNPSPLPNDPKPLPDLSQWITERSLTAIVVLKDGKIAHEDYFQGTGQHDMRISWSMGKSMLSAAFGIAVDDGLIPDLDAKVTDYVPALIGTAYDGTTIENILHMSSGVEFDEEYLAFMSDINKMGRVLALGGSMDKFAAGLKTKARPAGSARQYTSIDTHVLGMILRKATGMTVVDYVSEKLLKPMRLEGDAIYLTDGLGEAFVLGGMNMTTRDYARFGLMMAQNGMLDGQQIVPKDWAIKSTSNIAPVAFDKAEGTPTAQLGYGYQWWVPADAMDGEFYAIGIYGQFIYVNRPLGVVIAINSADRSFSEGDGAIARKNIAQFREISASLNA